DGIRDFHVTGVQTCALPILLQDPPAHGASLAAREGGERYPLYLGFARQLWTGSEIRTLRVEEDRVVAGMQRIRPPVMLEYDQGWNIASIVLEDAPRQFAQRSEEHTSELQSREKLVC